MRARLSLPPRALGSALPRFEPAPEQLQAGQHKLRERKSIQ